MAECTCGKTVHQDRGPRFDLLWREKTIGEQTPLPETRWQRFIRVLQRREPPTWNPWVARRQSFCSLACAQAHPMVQLANGVSVTVIMGTEDGSAWLRDATGHMISNLTLLDCTPEYDRPGRYWEGSA